MLSRRKFLQVAGVATASAIVGCSPLTDRNETWLVSACSNNNDEHFVAAMKETGELVCKVKLPTRGHDVISLPNRPGQAIVFARRPGTYAMVVDFTSGEIAKHIESQPYFHMYGHGIVTGDFLVTPENHYDSGQGKLVFRDLDTFEVQRVVSSGGVGPHQIALMPDNKTLVVANGGIRTHPDTPRKKLNLKTMQPNLSYVVIDSGDIIESVSLDNHQLSIRHLDVAQNGKVFVGLQYQGARNDLVPLAFSHRIGEPAKYLIADEHQWRRMNQYTASVCVDEAKHRVAISCPRSDIVTFWSLTNDTFIKNVKFADGAGLTYKEGVFATNGKGDVLLINDKHNAAFRHEGIKWDNHLGNILVS